MGYGPLGGTPLGGATVGGSLTVGDDVTVTDDLFVGDGTGSAVLRMSKADAGTDDIEMYSNGVHRCTLRLSSTENFNLIIRDSSAVAVGTLAFNTSNATLVIPAEANIVGALNHDGSTVGFFGVTPATRPSAYTVTNVTPDRSYNADSTSTAELADVLATLIEDLRTMGLVT